MHEKSYYIIDENNYNPLTDDEYSKEYKKLFFSFILKCNLA